MKKALLTIIATIALCGSILAQVLVNENFEEYTVGNKIAVASHNAGHNWWTKNGNVVSTDRIYTFNVTESG